MATLPKGTADKTRTLRKAEVLDASLCAQRSPHLHPVTLWRVTVGSGNMDCFICISSSPFSMCLHCLMVTEQSSYRSLGVLCPSSRGFVLSERASSPSVIARPLMQQQVPDSKRLMTDRIAPCNQNLLGRGSPLQTLLFGG